MYSPLLKILINILLLFETVSKLVSSTEIGYVSKEQSKKKNKWLLAERWIMPSANSAKEEVFWSTERKKLASAKTLLCIRVEGEVERRRRIASSGFLIEF